MFLYIRNNGNIFYMSETPLGTTDDQIITPFEVLPMFRDSYSIVEIDCGFPYAFRADKYKFEDGLVKYMSQYDEIQDKWTQIREKRDVLLKESDTLSGILWIDYWNSKDDWHKESWTNYRQALRDLPQSTENPDEIVWPFIPIPEEDESGDRVVHLP